MIRDPAPEPRVRFVGKRWEHHSAHSGYDRISDYLGTTVKPLDLNRLSSRLLPERVAIPFVRRSGVAEYSLASLYLEWAAARDMLRQASSTVYHILYGDDTYRYLGSLKRVRRHRLVVSYHLPPDNLEERLRFTGHLRLADAIVVVGTNQIPFFSSHVDGGRVHHVPLGVDTDVFCPVETRGRPAESTGKLVLFVGGHRRDFAALGSVISRVRDLDPGVRFVVVTNRADTDSFEAIPNVAVMKGIAEQELIELYRESDILLQPLEDSTANTAILEGLACGLPVVATDIGGVTDYLTEKCGVLTPRGDVASMVAATMSILRDGGRQRGMGVAARRRALDFAWPVVATQLRELYLGLS